MQKKIASWKMEIECIDTTQLCAERQAVKVIYVKSPLLFWVHLQDNRKLFEEFQAKIQAEMNVNKKLAKNIQENQVVVIMEGKLWQRGLIIGMAKVTGVARILLKDIGRDICLPVSKIYELDEKFKGLPWQAIACGLAYIKPNPPALTWSNEAKYLSQLVAEDKEGWLEIIQPLCKGAALVNLQLQSINFNASYDFKRALIKLEIACHNDSIAEYISNAI